MRARLILIASASLCLVACGALRGSADQNPKVIPWVSTPVAYRENEITYPRRLLSLSQAANAIKATVAQADPLLLPAAIPPGSDADLAADSSRFNVTYVSKAAGQRVFVSLGTTDLPPLGPHSAVSTVPFRKTVARYGVDDPSLAGSYRSFMWTEPGTWTGQADVQGVPYFLSATGMTDAQFWQLANSVGPIPWPPVPGPCQAVDLDAIFGGGNGAGGHVIYSLLFGNHGRAPCSLQGSPQLFLTVDNGSVVANRQIDSNPTVPVPAAPVVLQAGMPAPVPHQAVSGHAVLVFEWNFCPGPAPLVMGLVLNLPGGGGKVGVRMGQSGPGWLSPSRCDDDPIQGHVLEVGPFQAATPHEPGQALPAQLAVDLHAPSPVIAGQPLHYEVTLTNVSGASFHFDRCPAYREAMDTVPRKMVVGIYELNCVPVGTLAPNGTVTFAMVLEIPADAPTGLQELSWRYGTFLADGSAMTAVTISAR
jgi:hypothetical protein